MLHMVNLAADNIPVAGLGRTCAPVQKQFAIPKDGKTCSHAGKIYAGRTLHIISGRRLSA
jgi:hypothetical protein